MLIAQVEVQPVASWKTWEIIMRTPVVDSHQHFWDPQCFEYAWMSPKVQPLVRAFLPPDLQPILAAAGVDCTILVQAISSASEARWLLELASEHEFLAGVVAWCDLRSPDLGALLDELQMHRKFKGVRHQIENEPQEDWMLQDSVMAGFMELERRGIPYDMLVRPEHLKHLRVVRDRCPTLKLVIDHIAKPDIAGHVFDPWAEELERTALLPDTYCKLSGMSTQANWSEWNIDDLRPYVQHVVKSFGYDRVMFGSDWPVCLLAASYEQTMIALKQALGSLSQAQQALVWGGNACSFYHLETLLAEPDAGNGRTDHLEERKP
jgi:L-fuconolactonase